MHNIFIYRGFRAKGTLSYRELSQKNRFLQRTERRFQCANSEDFNQGR